MALDTPLQRDGGQMVANANLYNPGSALAGVGGSGQFLAVVITASRTIGVQTTPGGQMYGVLQNQPAAANEAADVGLNGVSKMVAGAAISAGAELMIDASGRFITWASGAGNFKVGQCLETVAAANQVFSGNIYNPNYKVVT